MDDNICILNRERQGLRIGVKSLLSGLQIKEGLENAERAKPYVYLPGEVTKDSEGYSFYIRRKISLKEYLKAECVDKEMIYCVVYSLQKLWNISQTEKLSFYNFLFDYDAVFPSDSSVMEFVYLPGAKLNKENNSVKDLLLFLLMHCSESDKINTEYLREIVGKIELWENSGGDFPEIAFDPAKLKVKFLQWKNMFLSTIGVFAIAALMMVTSQKVYVWPVWVTLSLILIFYTSPLNKRKVCVERVCYLYKGPEFNNSELTVGRDIDWADFYIKNLFVSRRHAVLVHKGNNLTVRDLFSVNGTFVDGNKIKPGEEADIFPGQIVDFGKQCSFCVKTKVKVVFK